MIWTSPLENLLTHSLVTIEIGQIMAQTTWQVGWWEDLGEYCNPENH